MAKALLMSGGVGGVSSDDVTAKREHILQGYTALTADGDDEAVQGTMVNRGYHGPDTSEMWYHSQERGYVIRIEEGYYPKSGDGLWKPYVIAPTALVKGAVNYHPEKTLDDTVTCDERGQIPVKPNENMTIEIVNISWTNPKKFGFRFSQGYYPNAGQYAPIVEVNYQDLANAIGVRADKMTNDTNVLGIQGNLPYWVCYTGDVISALNNEGFVWDDTYAGRGRGIVVKIPNSHVIAGANYVFLASPNLYPQNIRAGVNINGVVGTMPDYSAGRTVFNGATFDNELVSGVATKNFYFNRELYSYQIASGYGYSGVYGGGMNLSLRTTSPELRGRKIGCILSQSNNLTPFRRIVVDYRTTGSISGNPTINFYAFIAPIRVLVRDGVEFNGARVDGFSQMSVQVMASARQGQLVIDTSNINEQAFLGFYASANASGAENFNGAIQITKIEFFN